jgi:hypothetical protein
VLGVSAALGAAMWWLAGLTTERAVTASVNVLVAGLTLLTAVAALRSAGASELVARRASEALARALQPSLQLDTAVDESRRLVGRLMPTDAPVAVNIHLEWHLTNGRLVEQDVARMERWRANLPPGSDLSQGVVLADPSPAPETTATYVQSVTTVYSDEQHVGRWRQNWRPAPVTGSTQYFLGSEPELLRA